MKGFGWKGIAGLFLSAMLLVPAWASNTNRGPGVPGALNYVEGQVSLDGQPLDSNSVGSTQLQTGQTIDTQTGKAEVLLTPGTFLRIGDNSSVKMLSPSLTYTEVELDRGHAIIEVDQIHPENDLRVMQNGVATQLLKTGLYGFDADQQQVRVFDGEAMVLANDQQVRVKGGHEVTLDTQARLKSVGFDKDAYEQNDLYRFSSLRSSYLAEANVNAAHVYVANGWYGPGWVGAGWYWDPWYSAYTFIPGDGIFYSPFGWGFYSPLWVYRAPVFYRGPYRHFSAAYRPPDRAFVGHFHARGPSNAPHMAAPRGAVHGFAGSPRGFDGGAFHGGGFHGNGFHGGRH